MEAADQEFVYEGVAQNLTLFHGLTRDHLIISGSGIAMERRGKTLAFPWGEIIELKVKGAPFCGDNAWKLVLLLSDGRTVTSFTLARKDREPIRELKSILLGFHNSYLLKNPDELAQRSESRHRLHLRLAPKWGLAQRRKLPRMRQAAPPLQRGDCNPVAFVQRKSIIYSLRTAR